MTQSLNKTYERLPFQNASFMAIPALVSQRLQILENRPPFSGIGFTQTNAGLVAVFGCVSTAGAATGFGAEAV